MCWPVQEALVPVPDLPARALYYDPRPQGNTHSVTGRGRSTGTWGPLLTHLQCHLSGFCCRQGASRDVGSWVGQGAGQPTVGQDA